MLYHFSHFILFICLFCCCFFLFFFFFFFFFFFQAEDGIRDRTVTGVQTCALPILRRDCHLDLRQPGRVHPTCPPSKCSLGWTRPGCRRSRWQSRRTASRWRSRPSTRQHVR